MKKLLTLALTSCAFIVAMACGSNEPSADGHSVKYLIETYG